MTAQPFPGRILHERRIRVFVSSTFRDMQEERDHLVKRVFPQLRKLCEERSVTWTDVDLRWGITDEQVTEGLLLPLCLGEIERCRPFFIGLLGERYGSVPRDISAKHLAEFPWLAEHDGKSITELEIIHGVLAGQDTCNQAYFYFRDPGFAERSAPEQRQDFLAEDESSARKLGELKAKIRAARERNACVLHENYETPEQLGEWILEDFTRLIERLYPKQEAPDSVELEREGHRAYARNRRFGFVGREDWLRRLDQHADKSEGEPLVLTGEPGSGKSALLAEWAARWEAAHPDDLVIQHYVGSTSASAGWEGLVRRVLFELKRGFRLSAEVPQRPDELRQALSTWLPNCGSEGSRRIILVIDGLNQLAADDGVGVLDWFPAVFPPHLVLLVSSLPGEALEVLRMRQWDELELPLFGEAEKETAVSAFFSAFGKTPPPSLVEKLRVCPATNNALFLRAVLDELRQFGSHRELLARAAIYLSATDLPGLFDLILARWETDFDSAGGHERLVRRTLVLISCSRSGLSETELLELLGSGDNPLPRRYWTPFYLAAESALVQRDGLLCFGHEHLRQAVAGRWFSDAGAAKHGRTELARYFAALSDTATRKLHELPWQLMQLEDWPSLQRVLGNLDFFPWLWEANATDALVYWAALEKNSGARILSTYGNVITLQDEREKSEEPVTVGLYPHWVVSAVASLMKNTGHWNEAYFLRGFLVNYWRGLCEDDTLQSRDAPPFSFGAKGTLKALQAALGNLGSLAGFRGELDKAIALHREEEAICRTLGEHRELAVCLGNLAIVLRNQGNQEEAISALAEVTEIADRLQDQALKLSAGAKWANVLSSMGKFEMAEQKLQELAGRMPLPRSARASREYHAALATAVLGQKRFVEAEAMLLEDVAESEALGDQPSVGITLHNLAGLHRLKGDPMAALELLVREERICRMAGDEPGLAACLSHQVLNLADLGRVPEALALVDEAESLARKTTSVDILVGLLRFRFEHASPGNSADLDSRREELLGLSSRLGDPEKQIEALFLCADPRGAKLGVKLSALRQAGEIALREGWADRRVAALIWESVALGEDNQFPEAFRQINLAEKLCRKHGLDDQMKTVRKMERHIAARRRDRTVDLPLCHFDADDLAKWHQLGLTPDQAPAMLGMLGILGGLCRERGDEEGLEKVLLLEAKVLNDRGKVGEAAAKCAEIEMRGSGKEGSLTLAKCRILQSTIVRQRGRAAEAVQLAENGHATLSEAGDSLDLIGAKIQAGLAFDAIRDRVQALSRFEEAERLARRLADKHKLQVCLTNKAAVLADLGRGDEALACIREDRELCEWLDDEGGLARALVNEGTLLALAFKRPVEALPILAEGVRHCRTQALEGLAKHGLQLLASLAPQVLAPAFTTLPPEAVSPLRETARELRDYGLEFSAPQVFQMAALALPNLALLAGDTGEAMRLVREALAACRERGWTSTEEYLLACISAPKGQL